MVFPTGMLCVRPSGPGLLDALSVSIRIAEGIDDGSPAPKTSPAMRTFSPWKASSTAHVVRSLPWDRSARAAGGGGFILVEDVLRWSHSSLTPGADGLAGATAEHQDENAEQREHDDRAAV